MSRHVCDEKYVRRNLYYKSALGHSSTKYIQVIKFGLNIEFQLIADETSFIYF